jgi:hypothetical protein
MILRLTLVVCSVVGAAWPPALAAGLAGQGNSGIVVRLAPEAYDQAKACGRAGADCAVTPYQLCQAPDARYAARIATPFSRVAGGVFEAVKRGRRPDPMPAAAATRWGVGIYVLPAEGSPNADAIQRVELRRRSRVIPPLTSTVGPVPAKMPDGSSKTLARGFFSFPAGAFDPSTDVTVVFVGAAGETTCTLNQIRLQELR